MPEITLRGTPLSPGIALGKICFYWQAARHPDKAVGSTEDQAACLQNALAWMDLSLGLTIEVDQKTTKGFLVRKGGRNSHAAIVARALAIPAVGNIENLNRLVTLDASILIDGDHGEVTLNPSARTLRRYRHKIESDSRLLPVIGPVSELKVLATIDHFSGCREAIAMRAEGIGFYRTEMEALLEGRLLDEAEQEARYRATATATGRVCCWWGIVR